MKCASALLVTLVSLFLLCTAPAVSLAGDGSAWSVIIYDQGLNALVELSPVGYEITPLPDHDYPSPRDMRITNDRRYLVSIFQRDDVNHGEAVITDLLTGNVIPVPAPPVAGSDEFYWGYLWAGPLNPAMTEVALPYASFHIGGIVTVELATGAITHMMDLTAFGRQAARVDRWTAEGIWFSPSCVGCSPPAIFTYHLWNPDTGAVSLTDVFENVEQAERLAATSELLYSQNHPDFPLSGAGNWYLNVVVVYQPDENPPDVPGQVVYYDESNLAFDQRAHWVKNGDAFLVTSDQQHNTVVFRDGHQLTIDYPAPEYFFAMTSDGWLTIDPERQQIRHYLVYQIGITGTPLYQASGDIWFIKAQLQPQTDGFPPFGLHIAPPDTPFCPGNIPSRLKPGDWAEVLVNQQEVLVAQLAVGDVPIEDVSWHSAVALPVGAYVQVVEGPGCLWGSYVKVKYRDQIGWMLETLLTQYYLAPVSVVG